VNLDCLLDQAIGEKNKLFTYKKIIISHNKIKKGDQPLKKTTKQKNTPKISHIEVSPCALFLTLFFKIEQVPTYIKLNKNY